MVYLASLSPRFDLRRLDDASIGALWGRDRDGPSVVDSWKIEEDFMNLLVTLNA